MDEIVFLKNKYTAWYYKIVLNARHRQPSGYVERHHIVPRCLGGSDNPTNLVALTAREHFVCHLLLTKMVNGHHQRLMRYAVGKFIQISPRQKRTFTSWEYLKIRECISLARHGKKHSVETRQKISAMTQGRTPWNKGVTGIEHSEESNKKRSETLKGRTLSAETRAKISAAKLGKPSGMLGKQSTRKGKLGHLHSAETKQKISEMRQGIKFSEEHRANLSNANKLSGARRKGISQEKVECPHCGKVGGKSMMTRYHFNNCKSGET